MLNIPTIPINKRAVLFKLAIALLAVAGAFVTGYFVKLHGAGIAPDSVAYISVARHIAGGSGFINYDGYSFVLQPPLFPFLLAAILKLFSVDPLVSAGFFNAVIFGLIVFYSGLFLIKQLNSFLLALTGTICIAISFALIQMSLIILSEPLFILLVILYLYYSDSYLRKNEISHLIALSAAVSLACLTRYVGVIMVGTGIISILLLGNTELKQRIKHIFVFCAISILPTALWIARNFYISGTLTGQRSGSSFSFPENLSFSSNTLQKWFWPVRNNEHIFFFFSLMAVLVIMAVASYVYKWKNKQLNIRPAIPALVFSVFYLAIIIISSTTTAYDKIDNRLLSPVYAPVVFVVFFILDNIVDWLSKFAPRIVVTILFLLIVLTWMQYPAARTLRDLNYFIKTNGGGFSSKIWQGNDVINYLNNHRQLELEYTFYSNAPEVVYLMTDIQTKWSPPKRLYNSPVLLHKSNDSKTIWNVKNNKICLVWFQNLHRDFLFNTTELQEAHNLKPLAQYASGSVYIVENK